VHKAHIIALGSYLPEKVLSNQDLEKLVDTSDEWIVSRTGIKERRIAGKEEFPSDMGAQAAQKALNSAGLKAEEIHMIIVATMTPDYISPSTAAIIQTKLGIPDISAVDIQAACTGFLYALSMAKAYVESGMCRNVLVIAAEKMSSFINYKDRNTCVLFGDGAAAAIVSAEKKGYSLDAIHLGAEGKFADLAIIPGGGSRHPSTQKTAEEEMHYFKMDGKEVFKHAVRRMGAAAEKCLKFLNLEQDQISWLVPHQANQRILSAISKGFHFPEDKIYQTLHKYGNTSASSIGIALDELDRSHEPSKGEHLLLVAFGGGFTWGAAVITKI
jgi:3-oxoacyl-[acyl-carrier-protein] synthase-3